jgi:hypothetical protein
LDRLTAAVDEVVGADLEFVSDDDLEDEVGVISRAISRLEAGLALRTSEAKRRVSFQRHGQVSLTRWLAIHADMDNGQARALVGLARTMTAHPDTAVAVVSGEVSRTRARMLSRAAQAHPKVYERDEPMLVDLARTLTVTELAKATRYWQLCADDTAAEADAADQREAAYLHTSVTWAGMVRLDGLLDPATGEAVVAALDAAMPPPVDGDERPAANRRAEALGGICEQWLRNGTIDGGLRAAVSLTVDLDTLHGRYGKWCELDRTGSISPDTARRILCDADITRIVTRGDSEILDLGRATRVPTPALRRALVLRDRHCRFRGCGRPAVWCDAHHIVAWADGGDTKLSNVILLCRRHHTMVHEGRAVIVGYDAHPAPTQRPPPQRMAA